jgi:hypothetical protein
MEVKVNQSVWHIEIRKKNKNESYSPNGIFINQYKVIGISKHKICVNDDWFSTFTNLKEGEKKQSYYNYLNDINVSILTDNHLLGDGIVISLYSTLKPNHKTLEKMYGKLASEIDKKFGWLMNGVKDEIYTMVEEFNNF